MAAKKTKTEDTPTTTEVSTVSNIISDDSGSDFLFQFETSLEDAVAPEPLPEGTYKGEITDLTTATNPNSGKPTFRLRIIIPPENFPADFSPENAPDGLLVLYFGPDLSNERKDKWNARVLGESLRIPLTAGLRKEDFTGKQVEVDLVHREGQDGITRNNVKGLPRAV